MDKDKYIKNIESKGLVLLDEVSNDIATKTKHNFIDQNGYKYYLTHDAICDKRTKSFSIVSKHNPHSIENIQRFIDINGGGAKVLSKHYTNEKDKLTLACERCGKQYKVCWNHIWNNKKFKCNRCSRDRGYDEELKIQAEQLCAKHGYQIINGTYRSRKQFDMVDKQGYKYSNCSIANLSKRNNKTQRFHQRNKYQIDNMKLYLILNNIPVQITTQNNLSAKQDYLTAICIECGKEYEVRWDKLTGAKDGVPSWRCPKCSKRQSNLEYIVEQYLITKGIQYSTQKRFPWCREKRMLPFDFYLEDYNTVIEVNGAQHYYENANFTMSLKEQKERDQYKEQKCVDNGVNYVAIPFWLITQSACETYKTIIDNIVD